jgi:hypothetical protein
MFKTDDEAVKALIPFVVDDTNPLWVSGLLFIDKQDDGSCRVELTGFYYESEEDRQFQKPCEKERAIVFADIHKAVYDYLQKYYSNTNPSVKWNRLIVEVDKKGNCTANYEFNGAEVSPDAPPEPEVITAAYLCENLRNCLAHNAPGNYEWVWEILEKEKGNDGNTEIGGTFFYSLKEDKSNPQQLEPGEYIYMYTVSERLLNEFFYEKTKGWSKIRLDFSKDGKAKYYLLNQNLKQDY